ncbi:MAG: tRNA/rRNA methyltransferase SpoU [Candidatus Peregrinibacteria bacterium Greene0416_62]|nr:MAG: tRNA/rRNA methyltransferase SpoU [Candidatus Peregrinibacteria bacterium Greene0416_62]TSC99240.1 MAG: tRNA/rRNA methyltransferase SpoU [Candidatus Peregrinibacteria bacterium Greene1014_49]
MHRRIILLAHNIRSLWNIGALFRSCDCFAVEKLILSGYTATPPRREIAKTALGADEWIAWEKVEDLKSIIEQLRNVGWRIVGLEQSDRSIVLDEYVPHEKTCLIVGHEVLGVPEEILKLCDDVVHIPMLGKKKSLNVSVATGIALHQLRSCKGD